MATITAPGKLSIKTETGTREITAENIVIVTGLDMTPLKSVEIDGEAIVSSTGALSLTSVPKKLLVISAGVIGLEMGSIWRRLGLSLKLSFLGTS